MCDVYVSTTQPQSRDSCVVLNGITLLHPCRFQELIKQVAGNGAAARTRPQAVIASGLRFRKPAGRELFAPLSTTYINLRPRFCEAARNLTSSAYELCLKVRNTSVLSDYVCRS